MEIKQKKGGKNMDLSGLTQYLSLVVMGICLCVGFVIKNSLDFIPNKYIPAIFGILFISICL